MPTQKLYMECTKDNIHNTKKVEATQISALLINIQCVVYVSEYYSAIKKPVLIYANIDES